MDGSGEAGVDVGGVDDAGGDVDVGDDWLVDEHGVASVGGVVGDSSLF